VHDVAAVILAAGRSNRMGAFKPLLPFGHTTVIKSCLDYLTEGGADSVVVVLGHRAEDIREHLADRAVRFAFNPDPESEMSASIVAGTRELPETARSVLIGLVDHPAIPSSAIRTLLAEWAKGHKLVKPTWQGRGGHPVLIDLAFRDQLLTLDANMGLKGLFDRHKEDVRRVEVDSPYIARDVDTWDDYRRLYYEVFGETAPDP